MPNKFYIYSIIGTIIGSILGGALCIGIIMKYNITNPILGFLIGISSSALTIGICYAISMLIYDRRHGDE